MKIHIFPRFRALLLSVAVVSFAGAAGASDLDHVERMLAQEEGSVAEETAEVSREIAQGEGGAADEINDPLESFNRGVFEFNEFFLDYILRPITKTYKAILPDPLEQGISNALHNAKSPIILLHDVLQGEWSRASITARRFLLNSTLGVGGLLDLGEHAGMEKHKEDFGQTMAVWGVDEGPYLVVPILGPSNPRDLIGRVADGFIDPVSILAENTGHDEANYVRAGLTAVKEYNAVMNELEEIKKTSIDYYASIRSLYRQKRNAEILNGKEQKLPPIPDFLSFEYEYDGPAVEAEREAEGGTEAGQPAANVLSPGLMYREPQELSVRLEEAQTP